MSTQTPEVSALPKCHTMIQSALPKRRPFGRSATPDLQDRCQNNSDITTITLVLIRRLCDYTGLTYCPGCHWNARSVTPARIIRNWQFDEHEVS